MQPGATPRPYSWKTALCIYLLNCIHQMCLRGTSGSNPGIRPPVQGQTRLIPQVPQAEPSRDLGAFYLGQKKLAPSTILQPSEGLLNILPSVSASVALQQRRLWHAGSLSLCECGAGHSTKGLIPTQLHIRLVPDLVFQEKFPGQILCQTMVRQNRKLGRCSGFTERSQPMLSTTQEGSHVYATLCRAGQKGVMGIVVIGIQTSCWG